MKQSNENNFERTPLVGFKQHFFQNTFLQNGEISARLSLCKLSQALTFPTFLYRNRTILGLGLRSTR